MNKEAWEVAHEFMDNVDHCDCGNMNFDRDKLEELLKSYAKQQSIAFAKSVIRDVWRIHSSLSGSPWVSDDDIYNQFIEHLNNDK